MALMKSFMLLLISSNEHRCFLIAANEADECAILLNPYIHVNYWRKRSQVSSYP